MPLVDDNETDGFSFIWTIQNYSYLLDKQHGKSFDSPNFVFNANDKEKWNLHLYPKGLPNTENACLMLRGYSLSRMLKEVRCELSIRSIKGLYKKFDTTMSSKNGIFINLVVLEHELNRKGADAFLDDDSLTLKCRIWKVDGKTLASRRCYARSVIGVERFTYIANLENFSSDKTIAEEQAISSEMPSLSMKIFLSGDEKNCRNFAGDKIQVEIKQTSTNKPCFITCAMSLLDTSAESKIACSVCDEHRFEISGFSEIWKPSPLPMNKIRGTEKLKFRCEVVVSSGFEYSFVERVEYGRAEDHQPLDFADFLKDDLQRFLSESKFSDTTIRTTSEDFPVHKAILCARSPMLAAMFERDMKENRSGVIEIEDVDAKIISKMLMFVYTDIVEDLDCDVASDLYYAADKYGITALRRTCSDFLQKNFDSSNVCDVLVLAERHQDLHLKSIVTDFILEHAAEVMGSVEWKMLMKEQLHLASEIMHIICMRNLKIS